MPSPSVDIIVPVWNNPFETRSCLASILTYTPGARLIVVDNGSTRQTELMLDEFAESLGDQGLFMSCERNIGLVPALNRALAQSDRDWAVIVKPQVAVAQGWLTQLQAAADTTKAGIVTPLFCGNGAPQLPAPPDGAQFSETCSISFATLLLKRELRMAAGPFDESLDGGEWCLKDYIRKTETAGFRSLVVRSPVLGCTPETIFGSSERRQEMYRNSRDTYLARWGVSRTYCLYFGTELPASGLEHMLEAILSRARQGNRFTLILHRKQLKEFRKQGWHALHTGITLRQLPIFGTMRALGRLVSALQDEHPDLVLVKGSELATFPENRPAISFDRIAGSTKSGYSAAYSVTDPETP